MKRLGGVRAGREKRRELYYCCCDVASAGMEIHSREVPDYMLFMGSSTRTRLLS